MGGIGHVFLQCLSGGVWRWSIRFLPCEPSHFLSFGCREQAFQVKRVIYSIIHSFFLNLFAFWGVADLFSPESGV